MFECARCGHRAEVLPVVKPAGEKVIAFPTPTGVTLARAPHGALLRMGHTRE